MTKTLFCVDPASGPELEKEGIFPKIGCNLQMNFLHARLLHKSICPDSDWTQLNDSIHIPDFFTRRCFSFCQTEKSKISMFSGATSVTDWPFFFSCHQPLVSLATGTKWHWKSLCSLEDKGGPSEVTKLCYTKHTISVVFVLCFRTGFKLLKKSARETAYW